MEIVQPEDEAIYAISNTNFTCSKCSHMYSTDTFVCQVHGSMRLPDACPLKSMEL